MTGRTIQDMLDAGDSIGAYCHNPACHHRAMLDLHALRARFGPDHGAMHDDLALKLVCTKCGGRKVGIILHQVVTNFPGGGYSAAKGR